jgi:vacuolar-type H+-ATPase subunit E/Vma4
MGRRELLEALQREGRETLAAISAREAAEEERLRTALLARRTALQCEHERLSARRCSDRQRVIMSKAASEAALLRLRVEYLLALRLREIAGNCLAQLRSDAVAALVHRFVAELPVEKWRTVRVNPADAAPAAELFPEADIVADAAVSGGLLVTSDDGSFTVDNTLETRLERLWPELLPELVAAIRMELAAGSMRCGV